MTATATTPSDAGKTPPASASASATAAAPAAGVATTEGGDLVTPGPYRARAVRDDKNLKSHFGRSTTKKTLAVTIPFVISNMTKNDQSPSPFAFRTVRYKGFITENTVERVVEGLKSAGTRIAEDYSDMMQLNGLGSIECDIDVEIEEFTPDKTDEDPDPQPTRRNVVAWINPLGGRVFLESATDADLAGLGSMVKGLMVKAKASGGTTAAAADGSRVVKGQLRDKEGKVKY